MSKKIEMTPAPAQRKDRVEVREENIRPWTGTVLSVKHSAVSGWWLDVQEDDSPMTYVIHEANVRVLDIQP